MRTRKRKGRDQREENAGGDGGWGMGAGVGRWGNGGWVGRWGNRRTVRWGVGEHRVGDRRIGNRGGRENRGAERQGSRWRDQSICVKMHIFNFKLKRGNFNAKH